MSQPSESAGPKNEVRKRVWARRLLGVAAVLFGVFLILWNIFPAPTIDLPLTLIRNARGEFEPDREIPGAKLQVQAGSIKAHNSLTTANSSAQGSAARNCFESVLFVCKSHDALSQRVAAELLAELKKVPQFSEIKYIPPGHSLPSSGQLPDFFIELELLSLNESGLIDRQLEARYRARWGTTPFDSRHTYTNHITPPVVESKSVAHLDHKSTTLEVASSSAKYKLVAADIAKQFGGAIAKEIHDKVAKHAVLPELPAEFFAQYTPPPALPLEGFKNELIYSGSGLFRHNESAWRCRGEGPLGKSLMEFRQRLVDAGHKAEAPAEPVTYFRATKGHSVVEAFVDHPNMVGQLPDGKEAQQNHEFVVTFTEWATVAEREAAIDRLLDDEAPLDTLMIFQQWYNKQQIQRLLERIATEPPHTAQGWLWAGQLYQRSKEPARAREALAAAVVLLPLSKNSSQVETGLKSLGKDLGDEKLVESLKKGPPDFELVKKLGFVEATLGGEPAKLQFDLGGAGRLFVRGPDDFWSLVVCSVQEVGSGTPKRYELHLANVTPHGSSQAWGQNVTSGPHPTRHDLSLGAAGRVAIEVVQLPNQPRFEMSGQFSAAPGKGVAGPVAARSPGER